MKPARFQYFDPASIEEALSLLDEHGADAKVLAGGQSLIPLLNMRLARPAVIVDLRRLGEMSYLRREDSHLAIGALTTQRTAEHADLVRTACPLLWEGIKLVAHEPIRTRGTIGGTIAHADPAAELPAVLTALGGEVRSISSTGERTYPAQDFFVTFLTTSLAPNEVVKEVRFPVLPPRSGSAFLEVARRRGDFAIVGVAAALTLDEQDRCVRACLGLTGVGSTPVKPAEAEAMLVGQSLDDRSLQEVAEQVGRSVDPGADIHASAAFRKHLATVLTERALTLARDRARGGL